MRDRISSSLLRIGPAGLAVVLVVLLANASAVLGLIDADPAVQLSGLGTTTGHALLPGGDNIDPNIGFTAQAYGHLAASDWLHGHVPWWNPFTGVGAPLAGEMQAAALFPLTLLDWFANGQVWFRLVLEVVAGLSTVGVVRRLGCAEPAAAAAGCAFALNGTFSWLFHAPGNPVAFAPLAIFGVEICLERVRAGRRGGAAVVAAALALSVYAGFPEMAFIDGLLVAAWSVVRMVTTSRGVIVAAFRRLGLGVVAGVLISAPLLVAFVTYLPDANIGGHSGAYATAAISPRTALPGLAFPYLFGPIAGFSTDDASGLVNAFWDNVGGFVPAGLMLAALIGLAGAVRGRLRALRVVLAAIMVLYVARDVGVPLAIHVVNLVPGVSSTAFYRYSTPSVAFAAAVLAALGIDDVARAAARPAGRRFEARARVLAAGVVGALLATGALLSARPVLHRLVAAPHHDGWAWASVAAGAAVAGLLTVAALGGRRSAAAVMATALVAEALVLFSVPQLSAPRKAHIDTAAVRWLGARIGLQRTFTFGPLDPDYGSYYGLAEVAVNDLPEPKAYTAFISAHLDANANPLLFTGFTSASPNGPTPSQAFVDNFGSYESLGVRYLLLPTGSAVPVVDGGPLPVVYSDNVTTIAELPRPAPYFQTSEGCDVRSVDRSEAVVDCASPGVLTRRELWLPGWTASARGSGVAVRRSGPLFQQVDLPQGHSVVRFDFSPPHTGLALLAAAVGAASLLIAPLAARRRAPVRGRHRARA